MGHGGWKCLFTLWQTSVHYHVIFLLQLDILHMVVCKEEVSPEQERSSSLVQEKPEPPHIKDEQEEILRRPDEPDGSKLTLLAVKKEDADEDIASHCSEIEVELESDTEVTEDSDDWEENS